jgi:hypothetical protein
LKSRPGRGHESSRTDSDSRHPSRLESKSAIAPVDGQGSTAAVLHCCRRSGSERRTRPRAVPRTLPSPSCRARTQGCRAADRGEGGGEGGGGSLRKGGPPARRTVTRTGCGRHTGRQEAGSFCVGGRAGIPPASPCAECPAAAHCLRRGRHCARRPARGAAATASTSTPPALPVRPLRQAARPPPAGPSALAVPAVGAAAALPCARLSPRRPLTSMNVLPPPRIWRRRRRRCRAAPAAAAAPPPPSPRQLGNAHQRPPPPDHAEQSPARPPFFAAPFPAGPVPAHSRGSLPQSGRSSARPRPAQPAASSFRARRRAERAAQRRCGRCLYSAAPAPAGGGTRGRRCRILQRARLRRTGRDRRGRRFPGARGPCPGSAGAGPARSGTAAGRRRSATRRRGPALQGGSVRWRGPS